MKQRKRFYSLLLGLCMMLAFTVPAFASVSTISSVNIKVGLKNFEAGDTLPNIQVGDSTTDGAYVYVSSSTSYYVDKAEWVTSTSKEIKVGEEPRMKIWLAPENADEKRFKGSYHASNVKVTGGSYYSASVSSGRLVVVVKLNPVKGQYDTPDEAYWGSGYGRARWSMFNDSASSGHYEVALYRNSSSVYKTETTATSFNFYPYMTKAGTYYFKVRVIPGTSGTSKYGTKSDWISSDEFYLAAEDVSDGSGQEQSSSGSGSSVGNVTPGTGSIVEAGWLQNGTRWYFRYPDGSYAKNGWLAWNGNWYLFDSDGWMLTGWQNWNNQTYLLNQSGAMVTGWITLNNLTYYLNPSNDQYAGILLKDHLIVENGQYYYLNSDGVRAEGWYNINGDMYYFYPGTGVLATSTMIDGFVVDATGKWVK